jgi:hypothetical protein
MKRDYRKLFTTFTHVLTVLAMIINLALPIFDLSIAQAQDSTEEPAPPVETEAPPTEEVVATEPPATEPPAVEPTIEAPPVEPTIEQPTAEPSVEATVEPSAESPTEETPVEQPTEAPSAEPTTPPAPTTFQDDFQDGSTDNWLLSPGWLVSAEADNIYLSATTPNETATIANLAWEHFSFSARVRIDVGSTANIAVRAGAENYTLVVDANGHADLFRGTALLGTAPGIEPAPEGTPAVWRTLTIQALGATITASVDGGAPISYTDPTPLTAGAFVISSGANNTSAVALDDVIITQLDAPVITPPTAEPTVEVTETLAPEATPSVEPTAEAPTGTVILTADFESELTGWMLGEGASIVADSDTNHALMIAAGSTFSPAEAVLLADFQLDVRVNLVTEGSVNFFFRTQEGQAYVLSIESARTALSRNDGTGLVELASSPTAHALNTWHTVNLSAMGGHLVVTVNGAAEIDFNDATPLLSGTIAFMANSAVMLDDIVVTDFSAASAEPTLTPMGLRDELRTKMDSLLYALVEASLSGDAALTTQAADDSQIEILDEAQRVNVVIWAAEGYSGEYLATFVEGVGGVVTTVGDANVDASVPLPSLVALINLPEVGVILLPSDAIPTGTFASPAEDTLNTPAGSVFTEGFNILGANDWHTASVLGAGVDVAVIDIDFDFAGSTASDRTCLTGGVSTSAGYSGSVSTTGHGTNMVEIICDLAPSSRVTGYRANNALSLANAINTADAASEIIVIGLDLGANAGPGDGTAENGTGLGDPNVETVYANILTARNAGVLVIAAAGNSRGRYVSINYTGAATSATIQARPGDIINVSWNNWGVAGDIGMSVTGAGYTLQTKPVRPSGATPPSHRFTIPACTGSPCTLTLNVNAGGSSPAVLQVQVMDASGDGLAAITSPAGLTTTGNLARPADSANVLTVGAVCARGNSGYPLQTHSSFGPVFAAGGGDPGAFNPATRADVKPDVVGPSDVTVSEIPLIDPGCDDTDNEGFAGTSAAAAHIAGMAALIRSATDTDITNATTGYPVTTRQGMIDYMQAHTIDLGDDPTTLLTVEPPNGFDRLFGAGMPVLGNPTPDYALRVNPTSLSATCTGTVVYISPFNVGGTIASFGTLLNPYVSPAEAIEEAPAGACIILQPGEYVSSFPVFGTSVAANLTMQSYDSARTTEDAADSVFWVNDSYKAGGGINIDGVNLNVDGFVFRASSPRDHSASPVAFSLPQAIQLTNGNGNIFRNNSFTNFGDNGVQGEPPLRINASQNVFVENSTFANNDAPNGAALSINSSNAGTIANSVLVRNNTFTGNLTSVSPSLTEPVIYINNSRARIFNNRFTSNDANSIIRIVNLSEPAVDPDYTSAWEVQVFNNVFSGNTNSGPVVHLDPAHLFRFVNNTVVNSSAIQPNNTIYDVVILRGDSAGLHGNGAWDIHNNVFYNNTATKLIDDPTDNTQCNSIDTPGLDDVGARNNWSQSSGIVLGPTAGDCFVSLGGNGNIMANPPDLAAAFVGTAFSPTDPFQLRDAPLEPDGIDEGDNTALTNIAPITGDILGNGRLSDAEASGATVDMGAYEFSPLLPLPPLTEPTIVAEDSASVSIALRASGGFAPYTFELLPPFPTNYSTDALSPCGGLPLVYNNTTKEATYCPPLNFYTVGAPAGAPANIQFSYRVRDALGSVSAGAPAVATINITPTDDPDPVPTSYGVVAAKDSPISFRVRPYVRFDNFRFSETGNNGADYGYIYSGCGQTGGDASIISGGIGAICAAINSAGGNSSVANLTPQGTNTGFVTVTYNAAATDGLPAVFTLTITIVDSLPRSGLHDDTSFAFNYEGNWSPIYSEGNINNTLHRTTTLNSRADFVFINTGFTLYMQGYSAGGNWELQVDGTIFNWNGAKIVTANGITCRTSQTTSGVNISNRTTLPYTVSCTGLLEDESHTVSIFNRQALQLNIDAAGIIEDGDPLLPGFHDVNEPQTIPLFLSGWTQLNNTLASGGLAMSTTDPNVPDVEFSFRGTGFALGTILERTTLNQGAQYDVCVAPAGTLDEVCQHFDNALGATTAMTWNIYRPFVGYDPTQEYDVRIDVTSITGGKRMVIDSIVVFNDFPIDNLDLGTTEDDLRGLIHFGGGRADNWTFDTNHTTASNRSLTSIITTVPKAGPFFSFQVPNNADTINWLRRSSTTDSQNMLICVDRALGISGGAFGNCIKVDVRTGIYQVQQTDGTFAAGGTLPVSNPVVIRESNFRELWGAGAGGLHTFEVFSLTNQPFNVDNIQVIDSDNDGAATEVLGTGYYEEFVTGLRWFTESGGTHTLVPLTDPDPDGNFSNLTQTSASSGRVKTININTGGANNGVNEGMFFQFTGTGFSVYFTLDRRADAVQICWTNTASANPDNAFINSVLAGTCQTFDNESTTIRYQAGRTILGLPAGNHAVIVRLLADQNEPDAHVLTGSIGLVESPITMSLDAVAVYNETLPGVVLNTTGVRYETNYLNRVANNTFRYFGTAWRTVSGTAAVLYSGSNYDTTTGKIGAGVLFQTTGANTVMLYRSLLSTYTPMQVCIVRQSDNNRRCTIINNGGGTGNQRVVNVPLFDATAHTVSITTTDAGAFYLDAIELANVTAPALLPGLYQESDPRITYSTSLTAPHPVFNPAHPIYADWRNVTVTSYNGGLAMQSSTIDASVTFQFTGTGFSLITLSDTSTATNVDVTVSVAGFNDLDVSLNSTSTRYGVAYSMTGLPQGTYTITITEDDPTTKHRLTVDAIEVYGAFEPERIMPAGFYDDAQLNANGDTFINYGPTNATWTVPATAAGFLNLTNHNASRFGANINFQVDNAQYVTLYHKSSTSTVLRVCRVNPAAPTVRTCSDHTTVGNTSQTIDFGAAADWLVSITNRSQGLFFYLDGIGVHTAGNLTEGIYQDNLTLFGPTYTGTWTSNVTETPATDGKVRSTGTGDTNDSLSFTFTGVGFSILLSEGTTSSATYTLQIDGGAATPLTPVAPTTARRLVAITRVGLTSASHTIILTNTDATKPLLVDRVDILEVPSASEDIDATVIGNVENNDLRLFYFPFGSLTRSSNASTSNGNQQSGSIQGSVVFFELDSFDGTAFDYVRQISTTHGSAQICHSVYGTLPGTCTNVANNTASAYQSPTPVSVAGGTEWVSIANTDGKIMTLDFIRPAADPTDVLTAGYYEETYADTSPIFNFDAGFVNTPLTSASGGSVKSTTTVGDAALFQFNGTGFSVYFTMDSKADTVLICWVNALEPDIADVISGGTCQTYDNQSATARYRAARTIQGLSAGNHTAIVQMLADNNLPSPHLVTATPITMQIDAVRIYDQVPTSLLSPLDTLNTRYQTSFVNSAVDNDFLYFGTGWTSVSGTAASLYSGSNYDRNLNVIGASVVFTTDNADAIVIYRDTLSTYPALEVCSTNAGFTQRRCVTVPNNGGTGKTQPFGVLLNDSGVTDTGVHTVTITTLGYGSFILDAIEIVDTGAPLVEGLFEEFYPSLLYSETLNANGVNVNSQWTPLHSTTYSGGRIMQTTTLPTLTDTDANPQTPTMNATSPDGSIIFEFTGTGFEVGTVVDRYGGETLVCYEAGSITVPLNIDANCYRYQNEATTLRTTVSRTVTGLANGAYSVRVQNVEDGLSNLTATAVARIATYAVARLRLDYVRIFDDVPVTIANPGWYNENAKDGSGNALLQLLPVGRWAAVTGTTAASFSNQSYVNVVDNSARASSVYAGPVATLRVNMPTAGTVILYTGAASTSNSDQVLACVDNVAGSPATNCNAPVSLKTANQIVVSVASGIHTITFRNLTVGAFKIDAFQIIHGNILTAGLYDDVLAGPTGLLDTDVTPGTWNTFKVTSAYNGSLIRTQNLNATMNFSFSGTGFSVITHNDTLSVDMRICYGPDPVTSFDDATVANEVCEYIGAVQSFVGTNPNVTQITMSGRVITIPAIAEIHGVIANNVRVRILTTGTGSGTITASEVTVVPTTSAYRYGFAYYGLTDDTYDVEVRHIDTVTTSTQYMRVDAVAVFGAAPAALTAGLYDDTNTNLVYGPQALWNPVTNAAFGPPRGPYNRTEHKTTNYGAVVQITVNGNGMILYQTAYTTTSRNVRICIVTAQGLDCSDFSQNVSRATYFTPIAFFGFGSGNHQIIVENRNQGTTNNLSMDGVRVLP